MKRLCSVALLFLFLVSGAIAEESRILMDSYINGQPVKLAFDTGAEGPTLFGQAADRLKLSVKEPPDDVVNEPGKVKLRLTEECKFQLTEGGTENSLRFAVVDLPGHIKPNFDGVLGWSCFRDWMVEMNPSSRSVKIRDTIHFDKSEWKCLDIRTDLNILVVKTSSDDALQDGLLIDTGSPVGLTVRKELWQQLTGDSDDSNITLSAMYFPSVGLVVNEEKWIHETTFGDLLLHDIPVMIDTETNPWLIKEGIDGTMGMWALSCYTWIVDVPAGKIYFKQNDLMRIPEVYKYNRLGAVFVPEDIQTTNALIAHVIESGPAYKAGIRDGDELLKIGQLDATKWRTDPNVMPLSRFWEKPAGTQIDLTLMRNGEKKNIAVTLEEIFK
jgi:hypothetical protein